ncbi:hypothetical protein ABT160_19935 [Streptomyces sp. NPDC001941]|uniref:hypothetical protein n=1 Tax=Streptomyces sp. NPDC001941 TaxID=3154659 RepID=UPI0033300711
MTLEAVLRLLFDVRGEVVDVRPLVRDHPAQLAERLARYETRACLSSGDGDGDGCEDREGDGHEDGDGAMERDPADVDGA